MAEVGTHVLERKLERLREHHREVEAHVERAILAQAAEREAAAPANPQRPVDRPAPDGH